MYARTHDARAHKFTRKHMSAGLVLERTKDMSKDSEIEWTGGWDFVLKFLFVNKVYRHTQKLGQNEVYGHTRNIKLRPKRKRKTVNKC